MIFCGRELPTAVGLEFDKPLKFQKVFFLFHPIGPQIRIDAPRKIMEKVIEPQFSEPICECWCGLQPTKQSIKELHGATLIAVVEAATYDVMVDLCAPALP
ncbi:hypothetical protein EVAR_100269_1 [Eumeta japonica]|uniref:Uncharacterized protein n=1 Tax=Eumeta variegata TaxID=151549 RepID=A0A4C1ZXC8_EUMVA|nr:hypothetical protein EVAR_100269_1 [Eumeta japonica]